MIIGIEAERANLGQKTGVEHYAKQLILHLAKIDTQNQYLLYLRSKPQDWFFSLPKNFSIKVMPFPIFWTQLRISLEMLLHPPEVLFIPASALPIIHPKRSFVTIHDVAWLFYPEMFTGFMRRYLHYSTMFAVNFAKGVLVNSEATKKDLMKYYHTPSEKITTTLFGYEPITSLPEPSAEVTSKLPKDYIVFLSTIQPRKNVPALIEAFRELKNEHPELPHKLVMVGKPGWQYEESMAAIEANQDIVVYLGHVSDDDRWGILKHASLLVLPSFYEGFGMQLLEAYVAGIPVATSNNSSLPEVAGPGAFYFDANSTTEIKNAIKQVLLDRALHDRLVVAGREHLKNFSWDRCARHTLNALAIP